MIQAPSPSAPLLFHVAWATGVVIFIFSMMASFLAGLATYPIPTAAAMLCLFMADEHGKSKRWWS